MEDSGKQWVADGAQGLYAYVSAVADVEGPAPNLPSEVSFCVNHSNSQAHDGTEQLHSSVGVEPNPLQLLRENRPMTHPPCAFLVGTRDTARTGGIPEPMARMERQP